MQYNLFIDELVKNFPEIKDEILDEDYQGNITLQMGCFKRFTQNGIDQNNIPLVKRCFDFISKNIENVEKSVENSIVISYLGKLVVPENSETQKLLPPNLKEIQTTLQKYYNTESKNEKFKKFMKDLKNKKN